MAESAIDTLLEAASLAPSGDNTQPWHFDVDRQQRAIRVSPDPTRDPSPMNAGDRMSRLAIGAAIENMAQTCVLNGWEYRISTSKLDASLELYDDYSTGKIGEAIRNRVSNRRKYKRKGLADSIVQTLQSAVEPEGTAEVIWVFDDSDRSDLCRMISEADSIMLSNESIRKAFLSKVRFDVPVNAVVEEGLSLGTLELSMPDRIALRMMRWTPQRVLQLFGIRSKLNAAARRLADSADGFCLVTSRSNSNESDFDIGRVFQRSWLTLAEQGMASQPMMSLLVIRNILEQGDSTIREELGAARCTKILDEFFQRFTQVEGAFPSAVLRFGIADEPTVRSGRMHPGLSIEQRQLGHDKP